MPSSSRGWKLPWNEPRCPGTLTGFFHGKVRAMFIFGMGRTSSQAHESGASRKNIRTGGVLG